MRALVVYCHPNSQSYTAAVRDVVVERLEAVAAETTVIDLYAEGFSPALTPEEFATYLDGPPPGGPLAPHIGALTGCDTLIFVYPTWWYGLPAMLKGWLDRVLLPNVAFRLPESGNIIPTLTHISRVGVFTTCGASRWLSWIIGEPGRRTIMRGVRFLCAPRCRRIFVAHYNMDSSTPETRARHLARVGAAMDRLLDEAARPVPASPRSEAG